MNIRRSESQAILQSLATGVTPARGLQHMVVGRTAEINQFLQELQTTSEGACGSKILCAGFGAGKTFLLTYLRYLALRKGFVVAQTDLDPTHTLYSDKAQATYAALTQSFATRTEEDGGALAHILERWLRQVEAQVAEELNMGSIDYNDLVVVNHIQNRIRTVFHQMEGLAGGFDFAEVLRAYFFGFTQNDENLQRAAIRWLRGEYQTKTEAHAQLPCVRSIINADNWYDYIRLWARFVSLIGYQGLVLLVDECVNLYKISHPASREKNYEIILKLINDANQGRCPHLYVVMAGTPEFVKDERKGLYSYAALKSRLAHNQYETAQHRDLSQPVLELTPLTPEELTALLHHVRDIHAAYHNHTVDVTSGDIVQFVQRFLQKPGAREFGTVRECSRLFVQALNILQQNPNLAKEAVFGQERMQQASAAQSPFAEFSRAKPAQ